MGSHLVSTVTRQTDGHIRDEPDVQLIANRLGDGQWRDAMERFAVFDVYDAGGESPGLRARVLVDEEQRLVQSALQ